MAARCRDSVGIGYPTALTRFYRSAASWGAAVPPCLPSNTCARRGTRLQNPARLIISPGIFDRSTARSFKASSVPVIVTLGLDFLGFRPFAFFALVFFFAAIEASSLVCLKIDNAKGGLMEHSS